MVDDARITLGNQFVGLRARWLEDVGHGYEAKDMKVGDVDRD